MLLELLRLLLVVSDGRDRRLVHHGNGLVVRERPRWMSAGLLIIMLLLLLLLVLDQLWLRQGVVDGRLMGGVNRAGLELGQRGHGLVRVRCRADYGRRRRQLHCGVVVVHLELGFLLLLMLLLLLLRVVILDLLLARVGRVLVLGVDCGRRVLVLGQSRNGRCVLVMSRGCKCGHL